MKKRNLHAIYCDDIRHELSGKISLIGCYSSDMFVPTFPVNLARLCVHFTFTTAKDDTFQGPLSVTLMSGETPLFKAEVARSIAMIETSGLSDQERNTISIVGGFELSPLTIEKPTTLRLLAEVDGDLISGPPLWVSAQPSNATQP